MMYLNGRESSISALNNKEMIPFFLTMLIMHDYSFTPFSWNNNINDSTGLITFQFPSFSKLEFLISFIKWLSASLLNLRLFPFKHQATAFFIIGISHLDFFFTGHKHFFKVNLNYSSSLVLSLFLCTLIWGVQV